MTLNLIQTALSNNCGHSGTLSHHCGLITFWGTEHFEYVGHSDYQSVYPPAC